MNNSHPKRGQKQAFLDHLPTSLCPHMNDPLSAYSLGFAIDLERDPPAIHGAHYIHLNCVRLPTGGPNGKNPPKIRGLKNREID